MEDDEVRKRPKSHEVGMAIDAMSVEELEARIGLLEAEILRLRGAIGERNQTRSAAEAFFKL